MKNLLVVLFITLLISCRTGKEESVKNTYILELGNGNTVEVTAAYVNFHKPFNGGYVVQFSNTSFNDRFYYGEKDGTFATYFDVVSIVKKEQE